MTLRVVKRFKVPKPCRRHCVWGDCGGHDWYALSEIFYCRNQIQWIIAQFLNFHDDKIVRERDTWPEQFEATGYTDADGRSPNIRLSGLEKIIEVVGEVQTRLAKTGKDGHILILQIHRGDELCKVARDALNYTAGWWPKGMSYSKWLNQRKHRNKPLMI